MIPLNYTNSFFNKVIFNHIDSASEEYAYILTYQDSDSQLSIITFRDFNTGSTPSYTIKCFNSLECQSSVCGIELGANPGEVFITLSSTSQTLALICKYVPSTDPLTSSSSTQCILFPEFSMTHRLMNPFTESVLFMASQVNSPFQTNLIFYDFSSSVLIWRDKIAYTNHGLLSGESFDYDNISGTIFSWNVQDSTSDLVFHMINSTDGSQIGNVYK